MKRVWLSNLRLALLPVLALAIGSPAGAQETNAADQSPLPGVQALYAHEGDNSIIAYATPDGYARVRALVRRLDGDLDVIRTDVSLAIVSPDTARALGGSASLTDSALADTFHSGRLPTIDRIRVTAREDTPVDVLVHDGVSTHLPVSLVQREDADGKLSVELLQPAAVSETETANGTIVVRLTNLPNGSQRVLFLTPHLVPGSTR